MSTFYRIVLSGCGTSLAMNSSIIYHPYIFLSVDGLEIKLKEVMIESHLLYIHQ